MCSLCLAGDNSLVFCLLSYSDKALPIFCLCNIVLFPYIICNYIYGFFYSIILLEFWGFFYFFFLICRNYIWFVIPRVREFESECNLSCYSVPFLESIYVMISTSVTLVHISLSFLTHWYLKCIRKCCLALQKIDAVGYSGSLHKESKPLRSTV